ncbi:fucolectin-7 [Biomphalaria glabrata]|nr:fucolectin-7 [Biomphalaria glabrata]
MTIMSTCIIYFALMTVLLTTSALYNAARFKPATQSSIFEPCYAFKGVDGNYDVINFDGIHTQSELVPWWMVDLRGQYVIEKIQLTNRHDYSIDIARRLRNFVLDIFPTDPRQLANFSSMTGQVCYNQTAPLDPGTFNFTCPVPIVGRYVRLIMRAGYQNFLHICEMEVLVSKPSSNLEENYFSRQVGTALSDAPIMTMTASDPLYCLQECLIRRYTIFCTAFNWVTSTGSCQLFSVNLFLNWTDRLVFTPETYFFIQNNATL